MHNEEDYINELNEKINKRFIRNIVKPYNNDLKKRPAFYRIPTSSELNINTPMNYTIPQRPIEPQVIQQYVPIYIEPTCKNIHDHISSCKVCARLYRPYNNVLLIIIFVMVVIILFLIKNIYNF